VREFWVPASGGYVRDEHGRQVCDGLETRGITLESKPGELTALIRSQWRSLMRETLA